jgi:diguanylate cyclase (GGDEF)-like protein/PAS domain S-box-containing protein
MVGRAVFFLLPYVISALISLWMGLIALRRRSVPGSLLFAMMTFSEVVWTVGYMFQMTSGDLGGKLFWNGVQFIGAIGAPLAILGFSLTFLRPSDSLWSHRAWTFFFVFAMALLVLIWSDGLHHLFRQNPTLNPGEPFPTLVFKDGPAFPLYTLFAYGALVVMVLMLFPRYLQADQLYRLQVGSVLAGTLIPWVTSMAVVLGLVPVKLHDITPLTFGVSNLVIAWALYRYHLFEVLPAARDFLVENMPEGVLVVDEQLRIVDMNPAAEKLLGMAEVKALGRNIANLPPFQKAWFAEIPASNSRKLEIAIDRDGWNGVYELQITCPSNPRGQAVVYLMILRDICDRKCIEERLNYLAVTDALTEIYNRRHVMFRAAEEVERAHLTHEPLSLILFDIDHFKNVNDTFGHQVGDQLLRALTDRCQAALRSSDIFGRYGGEEFLIVLPDSGAPAASLIAERLRSQVESLSLCAHDSQVGVTISLGVATTNGEPAFSLDDMLEWVDQALYQAKAEGRNRACAYVPNHAAPPQDALADRPLS